MSMTCEERPGYDISIHVLKYALATLIQGVALALRHQLSKHASHRFYSIHQIIQLRKLSLGERSPALRSASDITETKEQMADFSQRKTELTRTLNDCQPVKRCGVVSSLPAHSRSPGKQSNSLVITNRRCLESNLSRHLGDRQFWHNDISRDKPRYAWRGGGVAGRLEIMWARTEAGASPRLQLSSPSNPPPYPRLVGAIRITESPNFRSR